MNFRISSLLHQKKVTGIQTSSPISDLNCSQLSASAIYELSQYCPRTFVAASDTSLVAGGHGPNAFTTRIPTINIQSTEYNKAIHINHGPNDQIECSLLFLHTIFLATSWLSQLPKMSVMPPMIWQAQDFACAHAKSPNCRLMLGYIDFFAPVAFRHNK